MGTSRIKTTEAIRGERSQKKGLQGTEGDKRLRQMTRGWIPNKRSGGQPNRRVGGTMNDNRLAAGNRTKKRMVKCSWEERGESHNNIHTSDDPRPSGGAGGWDRQRGSSGREDGAGNLTGRKKIQRSCHKLWELKKLGYGERTGKSQRSKMQRKKNGRINSTNSKSKGQRGGGGHRLRMGKELG